MKRIFVVLVFLFSYPIIMLAQRNYKPGYIVKANGDTAKGFVNYQERERNPSQVIFKTSATDNASTWSVADIKAFGLNDIEYFERYKLQLSQDEVNSTTLGDKAVDTSFKTAEVFVKVIAKGKNLNLFCYTDAIKSRFYISTPDNNNLIELGYHLKPDFGQNATSTANYSYAIIEEYKQQLTMVAQNAAVLNNGLAFKIQHLVYNERELRAVTEKINAGSSTYRSRALFGNRFFVGAGVNLSKLKFNGEGTFPEGVEVKHTSPVVNAGIDLFFNKYTQEFYIRAVLGYFSRRYAYKDALSKSNNQVTSSLDFKQSTFSLALLPSWNFYNTPNLKVFINGGLSVNVSSYNKYQYIETFYDASQRITENYPDFSKLWLNPQVNVGVEVSYRLIINAGYVPFSRIIQSNSVAATITAYQAGLTYMFGKL